MEIVGHINVPDASNNTLRKMCIDTNFFGEDGQILPKGCFKHIEKMVHDLLLISMRGTDYNVLFEGTFFVEGIIFYTNNSLVRVCKLNQGITEVLYENNL